jgi:transcriptional regulator with XRE-family HTH domain
MIASNCAIANRLETRQTVLMPDETLAHRVRRLREAKGLSRPQLARILEMSETFIYQLETGRRKNPGEEAAQKYAEALGVTVPYLRYGYDPPTQIGELPAPEIFLRQTTQLGESQIAQVLTIIRALEAEQHLNALMEREGTPDGPRRGETTGE